jgi:hypothetical protein
MGRISQGGKMAEAGYKKTLPDTWETVQPVPSVRGLRGRIGLVVPATGAVRGQVFIDVVALPGMASYIFLLGNIKRIKEWRRRPSTTRRLSRNINRADPATEM